MSYSHPGARVFTDNELNLAFDVIAHKAGITRQSADTPHCSCTHPCPLPVLERGALCAVCARSESCLRANLRMAQSRAVFS